MAENADISTRVAAMADAAHSSLTVAHAEALIDDEHRPSSVQAEMPFLSGSGPATIISACTCYWTMPSLLDATSADVPYARRTLSVRLSAARSG